jgi:hypothetical protein
MAARFSSSNKSELASLLCSPPSLSSSTSTTGIRLQPEAAAATATSPSMSKNRTVRLRPRLRLGRTRAPADGGVLARQGRAVDGAVEHAGSSSAGAGCCRAECRLPEKMALIRLASRAPGEAGLRQAPRAEAADGFLAPLALSAAAGCCCCCGGGFSPGATEAPPTPPEVRMGRRRRREYSTSDDEKYPRPEQSSAGAGAARWLAAKDGL